MFKKFQEYTIESFKPKRIEERTASQISKIKEVIDIAHQNVDSWLKVKNDIEDFKDKSKKFLETSISFNKEEKIDLIPYLQKIENISDNLGLREIYSMAGVQLRQAEELRDKKSYIFKIDANLSIRSPHNDDREIHFKYIDAENFEYDVDFYFSYDNDLNIFIPHRVMKSGSKNRFYGYWELLNGIYICKFSMKNTDFQRMMFVMNQDKNIKVDKKDEYTFSIKLKK